MGNEILNAALEYASRGWAVFPISKDKTPLTPNGCKDASIDPEKIKEWWRKKPAANVAIATGEISGGLVVVDIDYDKDEGKDGNETLREWMDETGCFIDSRCAVTGRGGKHLYFISSEHFGCKVNAMDSIDIRGDGGYVVAPPSVHKNGNQYFWDDQGDGEDQIVCVQEDSDVELFLHECFKNERDPNKAPLEIPKEVCTGGRNDMIFKMAAAFQSKGVEDAVIMASCRAYNIANCKPPLENDELERTVKSALRYEKGSNSETSDTRPKKKNHSKQPEEPITENDLDMPTLENIEEVEQEWLIDGWIPKGCVTLLCSDGGIGKTSVWCSLVSSLTQGKPTIFEMKGTYEDSYPWEIAGKQVMYFSKEDSTKAVLRKKIRSAGAKLSMVRCFALDDPRLSKITYGSQLLEQLINKYRPSICVFDTLQTFLPEGVEMSKRKDMRDALDPLNQLGAKYGTSFLLIMHTNKSSNSGRQRMADSSDIWDLGRSAIMAGRTQEDGICYMSHEKCNYGKLQKTILFSIGENGEVEFKGLTRKKDRDFMSERMVVMASPKKDEAKQFILDQVNAEGKIEISELERRAKSAGISVSTIQEARADLIKSGEIKRSNEGFGNAKKWFILLPMKTNPE